MRPQLVLALLLGSCATPVSLECDDGAPLCVVAQVLAEPRDKAVGIGVSRVALYQGVEVELMADGAAQSDGALIVTGRDALIRVFVEPEASFQSRTVGARFYVYRDGQVIGAGEARSPISGASEQSDLSTTINVPITASMLPDGELEWSVELVEVEDSPPRGSASPSATFPMNGSVPLPTIHIGGPMQVYLLPISWDHDGSGRLPDTSEASLQTYHDTLDAIFPTAGVDLYLEEPMPWPHPVTSGGGGWSELLSRVLEEKYVRGIPYDAYVYGLFRPGDGEVGGLAGLSLLAMLPEHDAGRAGIGLAMQPGGGAGTMAHEIGHAAGRNHAPCGGAGGPDPGYPHENAHLGVWGYHPYQQSLFDPDEYHDFMSYCGPGWVSDYHWDLLAERQAGIYDYYHRQGRTRERATVWQLAWVHPDGRIDAMDQVALVDPPGLEDHVIEVERGGQAQVVHARLAPFSHLDGGLLYLPVDSVPDTVVWRGERAPVIRR